MARKDVLWNVRVSEKLDERVREFCEDNEMSKADFLREAAEDSLAAYRAFLGPGRFREKLRKFFLDSYRELQERDRRKRGSGDG